MRIAFLSDIRDVKRYKIKFHYFISVALIQSELIVKKMQLTYAN